MQFTDNTYTSFKYKNHYEETQSILNGLKKAGNLLFDVKNDDFACFNIKSDTASKNIEQEIEDKIAEQFLEGNIPQNSTIIISAKDGNLAFKVTSQEK